MPRRNITTLEPLLNAHEEGKVMMPFELMIIRSFKAFSPEGGGQATPRKGVWIRSYLLSAGLDGDYSYSMFKKWSRFVDMAHERGALIPKGNYTSFKTYMWLLAKLKLIRPTRRERGKSPLFLRQYYTYTRGRLKDPRWENPFEQYESWKKEKEKGFPRPKKKKKRLELEF